MLIAGVSPWHEHHDVARAVLADRPALPAHVVVEAFAVLARMPPPRRIPPGLAARLVTRASSAGVVPLADASLVGLPSRLADAGVQGGATYDALIGVTAAAGDHDLVTLDERALRTYAALGIPARLLR